MTHESGNVINDVSAERVQVVQSAARSIEAERVELRQAAAQSVRGDNIDAADSALLQVRGADVQLRDCASVAVIGDRISMSGSSNLFVFARTVEGDVRNVVTPAAAFAMGLGAVIGISVMRRLRRRR